MRHADSRAMPQPRDPAAASEPSEVLLRLRDIGKSFTGVVALDGVDFELRAGEVHGVCGENGAGKSTLMKIISGVYQPDRGVIEYKGVQRHFATTQDAEALGIAIIHQELNLIPDLSVAENIYLAREPTRGGWFVDRAKLKADAKRCLERLGVEISAEAMVRDLTVAQCQMVEIAKALSLDAQVLIMDEPTSSLTETETEQLFKVIRELRQAGVGIAYISHRLDEISQLVDRVTVLRDGRHIATHRLVETSVNEIVERMVGRALEDKFPPRHSVPTDEVLLSVEGLTRKGVFQDVGFEIRRGEILGFAGLMGAGRTEVARAVFGADPVDEGRIVLHGAEIRVRSPRDAIAHGIAYLSEDRKRNGLAVKMSVVHNMTLTNMAAVSDRFGFIRFAEERAAAERYVKALSIKTPSVNQIARYLSGGNQQKVVIGKWLFRQSRILFFDEPTRGIDVGAKYAIYQLIDELASTGIGVVLISSELPEILGLTDRVAVFHEGRIAAVLETKRTSQAEIMHHASGLARMVQ
jgi:ribose transport system ATP-binding protein